MLVRCGLPMLEVVVSSYFGITKKDGLYEKYVVTKDGEPVDDCFVLRPNRDPAARLAILKYADVTDNPILSVHLILWLEGLDG